MDAYFIKIANHTHNHLLNTPCLWELSDCPTTTHMQAGLGSRRQQTKLNIHNSIWVKLKVAGVSRLFSVFSLCAQTHLCRVISIFVPLVPYAASATEHAESDELNQTEYFGW